MDVAEWFASMPSIRISICGRGQGVRTLCSTRAWIEGYFTTRLRPSSAVNRPCHHQPATSIGRSVLPTSFVVKRIPDFIQLFYAQIRLIQRNFYLESSTRTAAKFSFATVSCDLVSPSPCWSGARARQCADRADSRFSYCSEAIFSDHEEHVREEFLLLRT